MASTFESVRLDGQGEPSDVRFRLPSRKTVLFLALSVLWYLCSFLSASTSKALLSGKRIRTKTPATYGGIIGTNSTTGSVISSIPNSHHHDAFTTSKAPPLFPYPVSLTAWQFVCVFLFSYTLCSPTLARILHRWTGRSPPRDAETGKPKGLMSTLVIVDAAKLKEMVGLSFFNVTGHAMTSAAIQMVPVSTVHTIKALSPLFTVLSYVFILHLSYPLRTYISLAPLTFGVILACSGLSSIEGSKAWLGVVLSVGSTIVFVAQNLWSKKLLGHALAGPARPDESSGSHVKLDKLNILFWSSGVSVLLMIPMFVYSDLPKLMLSGAGHMSVTSASHVFNATPTSSTSGGSLPDTPLANVPLSDPSSTMRVVQLLVSNGSVHFAQNLLAFNILALTSPVTYSIASLFKRVFVICFAIIWFGQTVSSLQWCGIALTFLGLYLYNDSKQKPSPPDSSATSSSGPLASLLFGGSAQTVAAREEEAAQAFGIEKGSRRRMGILPTSSASAMASASLQPPTEGPIWKGMSSTLAGNGRSSSRIPGQPPHVNGFSSGPKRD